MRVIESGHIFEQTDYRVVLREAYVSRKTRTHRFSYAVWARELRLSSPSTLIMILSGKRHPSPQLARRLSMNLQLSSTEAEHFKDLVEPQRLQGRDIRSTVLLMEKLSRRRPNGEFKFVDFKAFEAMSEWQYAALREMVHLEGFREDPYWICGKLAYKLTPRQVKKAIDVLLELGLLQRDNAGKLKTSIARVNAGRDITSAAVQRYHAQALENARLALNKFTTEEREFCGTTFVAKRERLGSAKEWIRRFHEEFCDEHEASPGDVLYQLQICLFPLTRLGNRK